MPRCSLKQLYDIAEQLLLQEKEWSDFDWLEDEDREQVKALMSRGESLLAERRAEKKPVKPIAYGRRHPVRPGNYIYVPERPDREMGSLASRVGFTPFPMEKIVAEPASLRRRWFEALNRDFSMEEWGVLFRQIPDDSRKTLLKDLSERLRQEVEFHSRPQDEEDSPYEMESVLAKYSLETAEFLGKVTDLSPGLEVFLKQYMEELHQGMADYCRSLPSKMGLLDRAQKLQPQQWNRLAGLFPRRDLSRLEGFLPKDFVDRMLQPLPAEQKKEVSEGHRVFQEELAQGFEGYKKLIQSTKALSYLVGKVIEENE